MIVVLRDAGPEGFSLFGTTAAFQICVSKKARMIEKLGYISQTFICAPVSSAEMFQFLS